VKRSVGEKLKGLGLDVEFLAWLEGREQRLPELDRVRDVKDADFAAAIRAAEWLGQHFSEPELISPHTADAWQSRCELLEQFLRTALGLSSFYHTRSVAKDLAALERVLETLLPPSFWADYRKDILHLRKRGLPLRLPEQKAKPSGGTKQSEQTMRMRAAVKYISGVSKTPYVDLARFWNERLGKERYRPQKITDRLRKGHSLSRGDGAGKRSLEFWQRVYQGDLRAVFPGPFPLSPKLKERYRQLKGGGGVAE
jgi:hypothetical protein